MGGYHVLLNLGSSLADVRRRVNRRFIHPPRKSPFIAIYLNHLKITLEENSLLVSIGFFPKMIRGVMNTIYRTNTTVGVQLCLIIIFCCLNLIGLYFLPGEKVKKD